MGKMTKYRKSNNFFKSNSKNVNFDEKYNTPAKEEEWDLLLAEKKAQDRVILQQEEAELALLPTLEEIIEDKVLQMIEDGIVKPGPDYEPPE